MYLEKGNNTVECIRIEIKQDLCTAHEKVSLHMRLALLIICEIENVIISGGRYSIKCMKILK